MKCNTNLCFFLNLKDEPVIHIFANCFKSKKFWTSFNEVSIKDIIDIHLSIPQSAIIGFA